ncbi:MAG: hypothetical protein QOE71_2474, partial [Pseudonocardiales bacterium]|nr:hypothetical protein [Pseudonocardiales bacterium]
MTQSLVRVGVPPSFALLLNRRVNEQRARRATVSFVGEDGSGKTPAGMHAERHCLGAIRTSSGLS